MDDFGFDNGWDAFGGGYDNGYGGDVFGGGYGNGYGGDAFGGGYDSFGGYGQQYNGMEAFNGLGLGCVNDTVRLQLITLGFTNEEINAFEIVQADWGNVTQQRILQYGVGYQEAQRIKYLADIIYGKVNIDSEDELIKHLKKMKLSNKKVGMWDLEASSINKMPRKCIIRGLPAGTPFVLYNSGKNRRTFDVVDTMGSKVIIRCDLIPKLPYGDSKKLVRLRDTKLNKYKYYRTVEEIPKEFKEDTLRYKAETVAEILETNGKQILVKIHREYYRMCGRFIIVGSLRLPETHLGMIKLITLDGTRVYVYLKQADYGEKVKYSGSSERIYDYGFDFNEAAGKLKAAAEKVAQKVGSIYSDYVEANVRYEKVEYYDKSKMQSSSDEESVYELGEVTAEERRSIGNTSNTKTAADDDDW